MGYIIEIIRNNIKRYVSVKVVTVCFGLRFYILVFRRPWSNPVFYGSVAVILCIFLFSVLFVSVHVCSRRCRPLDFGFDYPLEQRLLGLFFSINNRKPILAGILSLFTNNVKTHQLDQRKQLFTTNM